MCGTDCMLATVKDLLHVQSVDRVLWDWVEGVSKDGLLKLAAKGNRLKTLEHQLGVPRVCSLAIAFSSELADRKIKLLGNGCFQLSIVHLERLNTHDDKETSAHDHTIVFEENVHLGGANQAT